MMVAIPLLVLVLLGINRHYRRFARRLRAGVGAVRAARQADEPTSAVGRVARRGDGGRALVRAARSPSGEPIRALLAPGRHTDPAIRPRWFDFAPDEPEARDPRRPTRVGRRRCSRRSGACRAASPTSSPWSSRSSSASRSLISAAAADVVPAQAAAALGARSRRRRRSGRVDRAAAARGDIPKRLVVRVLLVGRPRRVAAGGQLRPVARRSRHARASPCLRRRGRRAAQGRVAAGRAHDAARSQRRAVP